MRKLKLSPSGFTSEFGLFGTTTFVFTIILIFFQHLLIAQCNPESTTISGNTLLDGNFSAKIEVTDPGFAGLTVVAYDQNNTMVSQSVTDAFGYYRLDGLTDGVDYRIEFSLPEHMAVVAHNSVVDEPVRFLKSPACGLDLLIYDPLDYCGTNPKLAVSKFIQGTIGENDNNTTLITVDYDFETDKNVAPIARKGQTGAVWGMAFSKLTQKLYTSAFVKQYAELGPHGIGAIYQSYLENGQYQTSLYIDLAAAGINLGQLSPINMKDCAYGAQTGRIGLGGLDVSDEYRNLYAINIYNHSLLIIPTSEASAQNIREIALPVPGCSNNEYYAFAITYHEDKLYVGMTCTAETSREQSDLIAHVYSYDLLTEEFSLVFETDYPKGYWSDWPATRVNVQHMLTDISFTDEGNMIISLADRTGNRFCFGEFGRLDVQNGDFLVVWDDNGTWQLENNGKAGSLSGTGVNNGEGPGGGEFFAGDAWPKNPVLHPETGIGSSLVVKGTGEVIVPVYDPENDAYSGGLKKFNTATGEQTGVITIYKHKTYPEFGKAAGFGELALLCEALPVEVGNYLWLDQDKDGIQDPQEPGVSGVALSLYDENCNELETTVSDANGYYSFKDLNVDLDYYIVITDPDYNAQYGYISKNGMSLYPSIADKGVGDLSDYNDSDGSYAINICPAFEGRPYIPFRTTGSGYNLYNQDFGFTDGTIFDLALTKKLVKNETIQAGDTIAFEIRVFNQGTEPATEIVVVDYLPNGFDFQDHLNPGWKFREGKAKYKFVGTELLPGEEIYTIINLIVIPGQSLEQYINGAEISSALDSEGNPGDDVDSVMDEDPTNDAGGVASVPNGTNSGTQTDDQLDGDGINDEDDHDTAWARVFDLALKKIVSGEEDVFLPGQPVSFEMRIYNQGNEVAKSYVLTDYLPEDLEFDPALSPDWYVSGPGMIAYTQTEPLYPNSEQVVYLTLKVREGILPTDIVNHAEISEIESLNFPTVVDFDSKPNTIMSDDAGGVPGTETDNQIFGSSMAAIADEDDADPAMIHIQNFDLALIKRANPTNAKPGELVHYQIQVINQGSIPANNITVVDYLPAGLSLEDPNWSEDPNDPGKLLYTASNANGRLPLLGLSGGDTLMIELTCRVDPGHPLGVITNTAEIKEAYDIAGNNLGIYDEDSTPDDVEANDVGGQVNTPTDNEINDDGTIDEDDADPAQVYISSISLTSDCICNNNAGLGTLGTFTDEWTITAPQGQTWEIQSANGVNLAPGTVLSNSPPISNGYMNYFISGEHYDGQGYTISFINDVGDIETFQRPAGSCLYDQIQVAGPRGTCGGIETYTITNPVPNANYLWYLEVPNSFVSFSPDNTSVTIDWTGSIGQSYYFEVWPSAADMNCQAPVRIDVMIGESSGSLVSRDELIASVDGNCEAEITAEMLLTFGYNQNAPYQIDLVTPDGEYLPSNVITSEYLNIPLMAKLKDLCGGNTAMTIVTGVDNLPPVINCSDETVSCDEFDAWTGPAVTDNCDPDAYAVLINEVITNADCNSPYSQIIEQTYIAVDASGNESQPCVKTIYIDRANTQNIEWPDNRLMVDNNALVCGTYPMCNICDCDTFPYPDPIATGVPMLNGKPIYPGTLGHCQFMVGFSDVVIVNTPCQKVVARYWTVHEICDDINVFNIINYRQDIEIIDNIPPIPVAPDNITMTTNGESCGNWVDLPAIEVTDNCSDNIRVDMTYPGGFRENSNGGTIWLPAGENTVWYTLYDECDNYSQVELQVTIEDHTSPVAVCQTNTTVSLTNDGFAEVPAYVFDSGSYDDCTVVNMEVMRMEEGTSCGLTQNVFGPTVTFCCEDVGTSVTVVLRVYDENDNWSECMVDVLVQDVIEPVLTVPEDIEIECTDYYDLDDLSPFGTASVYDVCGATINESYDAQIDPCGTGYIDRIFTAEDGMNAVTDIQRITIVNSSPFDSLDITWPEDYYTAASCDAGELNPQNLEPQYGFPVLNEDQCDQVGFDYEDVIFPVEEEGNACYKILRRWSVMDWCQFDGVYKTWEYDQVIMVSNTMDPEIVTDLDPLETCTFDSECEEGYIEIKVTGDDDCTPGNNLGWYYKIDLFQDGNIDIQDEYRGPTLDLSGTYDIGTHTVYYTLVDYCGNTVFGQQDFTIKNCKKPTAVCLESVVVAIQPTDLDGNGTPDTEQAYIEAIDFDGGSYHACEFPLTYSFSVDTTDNWMIVDCEDLSSTGIEISLYVTDIFGNYDICVTRLYVQDNNDVEICDAYEGCVICPEDITVETCNQDLDPAVLGGVPEVNPDCPCDEYDISYVDLDISTEDNTCQVIQRDWTISFNCDQDKVFTCQQIITIKNVETPPVECPQDITVVADTDCEVFVNVPLPEFDSDACNTGLTITHNSPFADNPNGASASGTYPVGIHFIQYTLADDCGNESMCFHYIFVNDETPPECVANDITISLGANGTATIAPEDIDGGSTDGCGIDFLTVEPNTFGCENIGENTVTLTVFDVNGLSSTCTATVTVEDVNAELCSTQDIEVILDENGMYFLDPAEIYTGTSCGGLSVDLEVNPNMFDCDNLGENIVTLTVTETNGNSETCEAIVTVTDTIAPNCQLLDIDAYLDENGMLTVDFEDIDNGTFDPCGEIIETTLTGNEFTCEDVGEQTVTVTCTDNNGNVSICESMVNVIDTIAPECLTNDITVQIVNQEVSITWEDVDAGSNDECGIDTILIEPSTFTCANIGNNEVTVTVIDNNGVSSTCTAIVTVEDESGPLCSTQDIEVILNESGTYVINPEDIYTGSPCGAGEVTLEVVPPVLDCNDIGENVVDLIVVDEFGNSDTCQATITVTDTIPPDCRVKDINAYLDENGLVSIGFDDIDDGTLDPCGVIVDTALSETDFTCDDIGEQTVMVTLTDNSGNVSTCMSTVTVLDTVAPVCIANDITVVLDEFGEATINGQQVDGGSFDQCTLITLSVEPDTFYCNDVGFIDVTLTVVDGSGNSSECIATIQLVDVIPPEITCPPDTTISCTEWPITDYSVFGEAEGFDECAQGAPIEETIIESVDDCGFGIVTRSFTIADNSNNESTCTQIITLSAGGNQFSENNIMWGVETIETDNCADLDPAFIGGEPDYLLDDVDCYNVEASYVDTDLNPGNSCPDTLQRTWTVVDSCQLNETTGEGMWTFDQTIIVIDTIAPEIFAPMDTLVCGIGYIELFAYATDCGTQEGVEATNDSNFADSQTSGDASGEYIAGEYDITVTATDSCGNVSEYTYHLTVLDEYGECVKITREYNDEGLIVLHIDEIFEQNTECFDTTSVTFSLDIDDITKDTLHFHCNDLGDASNLDVPIPVFVWEDGVFIEEYCSGTLTLTDPFNFCDGQGFVGIGGYIESVAGGMIPNANIAISGSTNDVISTDIYGGYAFPSLELNGNYRIDPSKNDDILNGVSTLDLIHMQRHILGISVFDQPYQYIAADINVTGSISAADLFELRSVLLGIRETFTNNESWRFIPKDYEFENPANPLLEDFPEEVIIKQLDKNYQVDFDGIKVGDINGSIKLTPDELDGRSNSEIILDGEIEFDKARQEMTMVVQLPSDGQVNGFQFTLEFNADLLEFTGIKSNALPVGEDNIGLSYIDEGILLLSWHAVDPIALNNGSALFTLRFKGDFDIQRTPVRLSNAVLSSEWYVDQDEIRSLALRMAADAPFELFQNKPNPWANTTIVEFNIPRAGKVEMMVRDVYGNQIRRYTVEAQKGLNRFVIDQNDFQTNGLLLLEVAYNGMKQTRKMIKIN